MSNDIKWMKAALALARRGLGNVAPNPAVGCLIVKDDIILGRGWTQPSGRPHAETEALKQAGVAAKGATAYVTLEPCAHHGKTPPCAEALVNAGVVRIIVAAGDTDERVSGKGIQILQDAGVEVETGVLEAEASLLNQGFFLKVGQNRPLFTLKVASSLDGKIATSSGESKWITGAEARQYGHMLRATHDAILVGVNTVLVDDPSLTCRIEGLEGNSPVRVVLDSKLRTPISSTLVTSSKVHPVLLVANKDKEHSEEAGALSKAGCQLLFVDDTRDLKAVGAALAEYGLTRVLVEGGGAVHASFLKHDMCDILHVFSAPKVIGAEGIAAIGNIALAELAGAPHLKLEGYRQIGEDFLATYRKAE